MADFYQDASRHRLFAEHAQERGPLSGPEMCQVDLLEWSPGTHFPAFSPCSSIQIYICLYSHSSPRTNYETSAGGRDQCPSFAFQSPASLTDHVWLFVMVGFASDILAY